MRQKSTTRAPTSKSSMSYTHSYTHTFRSLQQAVLTRRDCGPPLSRVRSSPTSRPSSSPPPPASPSLGTRQRGSASLAASCRGSRPSTGRPWRSSARPATRSTADQRREAAPCGVGLGIGGKKGSWGGLISSLESQSVCKLLTYDCVSVCVCVYICWQMICVTTWIAI